MELKGKVVAITGGSKGFGRALAEAFIKEGAKVSICALQEDELNKTAKEIGALAVVADVRDEPAMQKFADETVKNYGSLDIWVNNAGTWLPHANAEDYDMHEVKKMFDVNVFGLMNGSRVALRHMKISKSGTIVNILSDSALIARPQSSTYSASKWAARGYTMGIREANRENNILVISVFPGGMNTDIFNKVPFHDHGEYMNPMEVATRLLANLKQINPQEEITLSKRIDA